MEDQTTSLFQAQINHKKTKEKTKTIQPTNKHTHSHTDTISAIRDCDRERICEQEFVWRK